MEIETPWGPLGYVTYKRTYARRLNENNPNSKTEEFKDTVDRVVNACQKQLKVGFQPWEEEKVKEILLSLKGSVAGRFMWQLGTKTIDQLGLMSLQNCAFTVVNEPIRPFVWAMDALMLGSGVGYNIQREHVYELPKVNKKKIRVIRKDSKDADFIVPDSREGWIELLRRCLEAHFHEGRGFTYSTICIRGKGEVIKGFGGVASGPNELCWGIEQISNVLNNRRGKKLRPIDCLDIMNIIGYIVVAGNVRRSAQIAIGDYDDIQFLEAKRWDNGIPNWRAMSNNSVVCNDIALLPEQFWEGYNGNGEPYGLINLKLAQTVGRAGDFGYPDPDVQGFNPCAEQSLAPFETCCLAEIHLPNIESQEELDDVAHYLYRICKHSLALPCHAEETQAIVHKNMRMGIGITGYCMATEEQQSWLPETYEFLRKLDSTYSELKEFPISIKLTTIKPSGTLSLLSGVTPGAHPGFSHYHIRRIRMASDSALVNVCRQNGYNIEFQRNFDGTDDTNTVVVEFPSKFPDHTIVSKDMSAIEQLELVKKLQTEWSDNAVSVTVYYRKEELPSIQLWLKHNYNDNLKTVSFLLHSDHGFDQAPLEEITRQEYEDMIKSTKPITNCEVNETDIKGSFECATGMCPVK
jgi:ribonucleoside-triphosphate reductase